MTISERITKIRGKISRDEFAEKIGIHPQTLYMYEKGKREVKLDTIEKICAAYKISVEWLIDGRGAMQRDESIEKETSMDLTLAQISPETTGMLGGMQDKMALIEAGVAIKRLVLSKGHAPSATCRGCATLQGRLDKANERLEVLSERLYGVMKENGDLKEEVGRLNKELVLLKNKLPFSNSAAEPPSDVSQKVGKNNSIP